MKLVLCNFMKYQVAMNHRWELYSVPIFDRHNNNNYFSYNLLLFIYLFVWQVNTDFIIIWKNKIVTN